MKITRDNIASFGNMEMAMFLGTFFMMKNAPEAKSFIIDMRELTKMYDLVKDENCRRFGIESVTEMLEDMNKQLKMRELDKVKVNAPKKEKKVESGTYFLIANSEHPKQYLHPTTPTANTYIWKEGVVGAAGFYKEAADAIANDPTCKPRGVVVPMDSLTKNIVKE